jgi:mono/diheme cytochrome c family protein
VIKQILRDWKPKWYPNRWRNTLIAIPIVCLALPLLILALPYIDALNDMAVQPKGKAQGTYGHDTGYELQVERPPVKGTLPAQPPFYPYRVTEKDELKAAKIAGETLHNPLKPTEAVLREGEEIFNRICFTCHGTRAEGNGPIVGPNLFPAPPSLHTKQARNYPDGRIWHVITRGQNKMPSYADTLTPRERWEVVYYVRALQLAKKLAEGK